MIRIGHGADGVHHIADGRPVLAVGGDVGLGALPEHIGGDIHPGVVESVAGVHQESLHRLGFALAVFVAVVNGPLLEGPCAVGKRI